MLGPTLELETTLEFYSLVSKELQRADLQLWKGAKVKVGTEDVMEEEEERGSRVASQSLSSLSRSNPRTFLTKKKVLRPLQYNTV